MFARAWAEFRGRRREGDEACTLMHIGIEAAGRTWDTTYETAQLHESYLAAKSDDARYAVVEEYIVCITVDFKNRVDGAFPSRPAHLPVRCGLKPRSSESRRVERPAFPARHARARVPRAQQTKIQNPGSSIRGRTPLCGTTARRPEAQQRRSAHLSGCFSERSLGVTRAGSADSTERY